MDSLLEYVQLGLLVIMTLVVMWQVLARYTALSVGSWATELALLLMIWVGFMGVAVGFREGSHIALTFVANLLPEGLRWWLEKIVCGLSFAFGAYLVVQGWEFTTATMSATLPGTGIPRGMLYAVVPVAGLMISIYSALQLFGFRTAKHPESLEGGASEQETEDGDVRP